MPHLAIANGIEKSSTSWHSSQALALEVLPTRYRASGLYARAARKSAVGVGAAADSPSPSRTPKSPQRPRQLSQPSGIEEAPTRPPLADVDCMGLQAFALPPLRFEAEAASPARWIACKRRCAC